MPKKDSEPMINTPFRLPRPQLEFLRERAAREGRTVSEIVRELIAREMRAVEQPPRR